VEEVFIVVPSTVTVEDVTNVLRRSWRLDEEMSDPYIEDTSGATAYVVEHELDEAFLEEFFLDRAGMLETLRERVGDFRILGLRYRGPALAREVARSIAASELAADPMLLDADGSLLPAAAFLGRLCDGQRWDWFP
jgi:hypothetical protein